MGGPAVTTLATPRGQVENLLVSSSNVTVDGFSVSGGQFCAMVQDFQHGTDLTNVNLRDLNLTPTPTVGHGILFERVSDSQIVGCTVGLSYANDVLLDGGSDDDLVADCTLNGTVTGHAIAVNDSDRAQLVDNTVTAAAFDGIILLTSSGSRVSGNDISGHTVDGVCATAGSDDDLIELNTIVSNGYAAGRPAGVGVWLNSESDRDTVLANTISGSPECAVDVFASSDDVIRGNDLSDCYQGGVFVWDAPDYAPTTGSPPDHTTIADNYVHDIPNNAAVVLRGATDSTVTGNAVVGHYTGAWQSSTDGGIMVQHSADTTFARNTILSVENPVYVDAPSTAFTAYRNRFVHTGENYVFTGATATFDAGLAVGGNYWGNGVAGTPYTDFIFDPAGTAGGGGYADRYPAADPSLGLGYAPAVTAPAAGGVVADGSHRAIEWTHTGATLVDLYYSSAETGDVLIAGNLPDNGVYDWTVPALPGGTDYAIKVVPEDTSDTARGPAAVGGTFTVAGAGGLTLLSPGRDVSAAAGGHLTVAWADAAVGTPVDVQMQTDGGAWATVAANVTADDASVALPNGSSADVRFRVVDPASDAGDTQDGSVRVSGTAAVDPVQPGSAAVIGSVQPIAWSSPAGSVSADVQLYDGSAWRPIATGVPDVGHVDWFVPEASTDDAQVRVTFHDAAGTTLGTATGSPFAIHYSLAAGAPETVYRLYNPLTQEHLFTTDANEYAVLATRQWSQEGAAYQVFDGSAELGGSPTVPEYRLYNAATRQHLWTTDRNEYFTLRDEAGWTAEGVAAYVLPTTAAAGTPLYRLSYSHGPTSLHLWTTDPNEYDSLVADGWAQEGPIGRVLAI